MFQAGGQLFARVGPQFPCIVFLDSTLVSNHNPTLIPIRSLYKIMSPTDGSVTNRQHRDDPRIPTFSSPPESLGRVLFQPKSSTGVFSIFILLLNNGPPIKPRPAS